MTDLETMETTIRVMTMWVAFIYFIISAVIFSVIFLISRHVFKVKNRIMYVIIVLIISLLINSVLGCMVWWLVGYGFGGMIFCPGPDLIFPWTDCSYYDYCQHQAYGRKVHVQYGEEHNCKIIQSSQYGLIAFAALVITAPYIYQKAKDITKDR